MWFPRPAPADAITPSGGNLTLSSTNPFDSPIINPGLLGDSAGFDLYAMREALKAGRRFLSAPSLGSYIISEYGDSANATTDDEIDAYVKANALVVNHVSGTAAMGKSGSTGKGSGALNSDLTVKGTIGLRVVDASAFVSVLVPSVRVDRKMLTYVPTCSPSSPPRTRRFPPMRLLSVPPTLSRPRKRTH